MAEKKRTRKELLKSQDEFITFSTRAIRFVRGNSTYFYYLGIALAAIGLSLNPKTEEETEAENEAEEQQGIDSQEKEAADTGISLKDILGESSSPDEEEPLHGES